MFALRILAARKVNWLGAGLAASKVVKRRAHSFYSAVRKASVQFAETRDRTHPFGFGFPGQTPSAWRPFGHPVRGPGGARAIFAPPAIPSQPGRSSRRLARWMILKDCSIFIGDTHRVTVLNTWIKLLIVNIPESFADHIAMFITLNILLKRKIML